MEKLVTSFHSTTVLLWLPVKGKRCVPGLSDGMVSPQGGSVCAGVRLCGVGRVMVSDRCSSCEISESSLLRTPLKLHV